MKNLIYPLEPRRKVKLSNSILCFAYIMLFVYSWMNNVCMYVFKDHNILGLHIYKVHLHDKFGRDKTIVL